MWNFEYDLFENCIASVQFKMPNSKREALLHDGIPWDTQSVGTDIVDIKLSLWCANDGLI